MKFFIYLFVIGILVGLAAASWTMTSADSDYHYSEYETVFEEIDLSAEKAISLEPKLQLLKDWQRPEGPLKVGLQIGHWKNEEVPVELEGLKKNAGGARGAGKYEWEVMLNVALITADQLRSQGIEVDLLPTTVPPNYYADAFIALHADGNLDTSVTGFKVASPYRDYSNKSKILENSLYEEYAKATGLNEDPNITGRMRGYYAFNWRRYEHSIHPMTPAAILETGFLTSRADQKVLINNPEVVAQGITNAILKFLGLK